MADWRRRFQPWWWLIPLLTCGLVLIVPVGLRVHRISRHHICAKNLQSLVTAVGIYHTDLPGSPFASSDQLVDAMLAAGVITTDESECPITGARFVVVNLDASPTQALAFDSRTVMAYEPLTDPKSGCGWIVFADGHALCVCADEHQVTIAAGRQDG